MTDSRPLLSICIPTYNRGGILQAVLQAYVDNKEFDDEVEIVISDNASTDNTESICRGFAQKYHNVKYHRNEINILDENFPLVLDLAEGEYLKLMNDWVFFDEDGLRYVKDCVKKHLSDREPLFFTGNWIDTKYKGEEVCICKDLNDYVKVVSTFVTSNNLFGAWREQWAGIEDKRKYHELQLQQDEWTYRLVVNHGGCVVFNKEVLVMLPLPQKPRGGYNWFQIHLDNYYTIMHPYVEAGLISKETLTEDKLNLYKHFIPELTYTFVSRLPNKYWRFDTEGTAARFRAQYKDEPSLRIHLMMFPFYSLRFLILWYMRNLKWKLKTQLCK